MLGGAPLLAGVPVAARAQRDAQRQPNVVLVMTDDQSYGDLACHGNPHLRTPRIDQLHEESARFTNFYVSPVCSPTRASLMTGRYNYRTGVVDTYIGRSMMDPGERTIAEALRDEGYRTGIFGKWHLGDNYPMRAMDKGFEESLVHRGGGIAQPSDPPLSAYFNPILQHNGVERQTLGYCTDVFTDAAIGFIERHQEEPFFCYLSTNAPHVPLEIHERYVEPYRAMGLDEETARTYAMIENIDENVGRLMDTLSRLGLAEDTIFIFLTDNGGHMTGDAQRFDAGLRSTKGTLYEGGIRVPFFVRWPRGIEGGQDIDETAAHIDLFPTLQDLCGLSVYKDRVIDGLSLAPLLGGAAGESRTGSAGASPSRTGSAGASPYRWPERNIFLQWHRGDEPEPFRGSAVRGPRYKLVNGEELYDLEEDPGETRDIAAEQPEIVAELRSAYEAWFEDVSSTRGYHAPRIHVGTPHENPTLLTGQDWRGADTWINVQAAHWELHIAEAGTYDVSLITLNRQATGRARIEIGGQTHERAFSINSPKWTFEELELPAGDTRFSFEVLEVREGVEGIRFGEVARIA